MPRHKNPRRRKYFHRNGTNHQSGRPHVCGITIPQLRIYDDPEQQAHTPPDIMNDQQEHDEGGDEDQSATGDVEARKDELPDDWITQALEGDIAEVSDQHSSKKRPLEANGASLEADCAANKKRRTLGELNGSESRLNSQANHSEDLMEQVQELRAIVAVALGDELAENVTPSKQNPDQQPVKLLRTQWPRFDTWDDFVGKSIPDQRSILDTYPAELLSYVDMVEAGAVPIALVRSYMRRAGAHLNRLDENLNDITKVYNKMLDNRDEMTRAAVRSADLTGRLNGLLVKVKPT